MSTMQDISLLQQVVNAKIRWKECSEAADAAKNRLLSVQNAKEPKEPDRPTFFSMLVGFIIGMIICLFVGLIFAWVPVTLIVSLVWWLIGGFNSGAMAAFTMWEKQVLKVIPILKWASPLAYFLAAGFIPLIITVAVCIIACFKWYCVDEKKDYPKKVAEYHNALKVYEENRQNIPALQAEWQKAQNKANNVWNLYQSFGQRGLHPAYLDSADWLLDLMQRGRADSLKEAINLMESERAQMRRERAEEEHRIAMERHAAAVAAEMSRAADAAERGADEAARAAEAADDAAAWSAASTFLALHEAKRRD